MTSDKTPPSKQDLLVRSQERGGHHPFPVVGIGASAGGYEAYCQLLASLPADTGMAFILIQHLDARHESRLTELLARKTAMPVIEATQGMALLPNRVYVIPPNVNLATAHGVLELTPRGEGHGPHLPVDFLFRSLAEEQQARAIGVILSGTGSDGTLGLCEIKAVGGITFVQSEDSAQHSGMPTSAILSGCADFVLAPPDIARRLAEIGTHPYLSPTVPEPQPEPEAEDHFKEILGVVRSVMGVDFRLYRDTTIRRRIMRRMALHTQQSWSEYLERLRTDRTEVEALYHDLLINVTSFFRDPAMYEALKSRVYPELAKGKSATVPLRVWVPGCSTGQEAFSIAISLLEFFDDKPIRPPIQIFATDLTNENALDKGRVGIYPESVEAEVSPERLRRFFTREDHVYRIDKRIRDMCVFARQNVTADPPFSHLDLISCRNLLIYLATPLQRRMVPTFHYALNFPGFLVLGSAETVGDHADLFELIDSTHKIYAKKQTAARTPMHYLAERMRGIESLAPRSHGHAAPSPADFQREADRILLNRYVPAGVLVNENFDIVQFRGRTTPYLEVPAGEPTINVLKLAAEGLFLELRSALNEAKKTSQLLIREGVTVRTEGRSREITLEVVPVKPSGGGQAFLILFREAAPVRPHGEESAARAAAAERAASGDAGREIIQLRQELSATKEYLQSLVEQQDAANEELRSANEEILSSNEELQSTNEELQTAKEELQSANEELTTVNEQLQVRNVELSQVNNDMVNLMSSTNIPVVMVGGDLRIRRFTPPARKAMSLLTTDIGRPIIDIKPALLVPDLEAIIEAVIESVQPQERVVRDRDGRWYSLRIHPYRTQDHRIDGVVLMLVDIDQQKRAEETLRNADRIKDEFLATLAHELRNPLSPICNAVEIMHRAGGDAAAVAQARDILYRQVPLLARIVDDLIDVSRIIERKISLKLEDITLAAVVKTALEACRPLMESRRHRVTAELPSAPVHLRADPERLEQIVINLLNNAAKYTDNGGEIHLSAEIRNEPRPWQDDGPLRTSTEDLGYVVIRVRDTGIGISPEFLPHVFEMFTQEDRSLERTRGGLGVGLSLVRALVQMHGGHIEAQSAGPGQGSEFIVRLPLAPTPSTGQVAQPGAGMPQAVGESGPKRILIVDDNADQREGLRMLLELLGHRIRFASDGPGALEAAVDFVPDVALIDIGIPRLNGYDVARRLRQRPELQHAILIAQTGWGQDEDRQRSREAGFDHHLVKPIDIALLERILAAAPARSGSGG